jgi:hypothetical protein
MYACYVVYVVIIFTQLTCVLSDSRNGSKLNARKGNWNVQDVYIETLILEIFLKIGRFFRCYESLAYCRSSDCRLNFRLPHGPPLGRTNGVHVVQSIFVVQSAAEITPTFRKIAVGSPKQIVGCGPFR